MQLAGRILTPEGQWLTGTLSLGDGRVVSLREGAAKDRTLLPGFVDLHVHGGGGANVMDGAEGMCAAAAFHLRHGTTALCPTTLTRPLEELRRVVATAGALADGPVGEPSRARLLGVHLEGPFIAESRRGAQPPYVLAPDRLALESLLDAGPVATVTLAPELPGAAALIRLLKTRGVRASLGHSDCDLETARLAFAAGAVGATHLFNAMSGLHHRRPGLAAAALEAEDVILELILDGHHVHPSLFRLACRSTRGRLALITDAISAAGVGPGPSELGGQPVIVSADGHARLANGKLAGSLLTLDRALANAVQAGLPLEEAALLVTRNPADALGREDLGRLVPGALADVVELNADLEVTRVVRGGVEVELS